MSRQHSVSFSVQPGGRLEGRVRVPGDKSVSHRFVILASLAEGASEAEGFLEGKDTIATVNAFRHLGVDIDGPREGRIRVDGAGLAGLSSPPAPLDMGNSGTAMRLLAGVLAGQRFDTTLTGDASLSARPMTRITDPLRAMGARIDVAPGGTPPLEIHGVDGALRAIDYTMPVASAQVKSCLLLAGLYADGVTRVIEPAPTRDHTERMLTAFGCPPAVDGSAVRLSGGGTLRAAGIEVPGDISSAAFFMVGATIAGGSDLLLENVGINPTRVGAVDILTAMGANIVIQNRRQAGGEPVADIRVRAARLKGIEIPEHLVPLAIDEFPAIFIAAACASGETRVSGARELRVKESDRIAVMAEGLKALGVEAEPTADGMRIVGGRLGGGRVDSHGDHRIAMAFAMAALASADPIRIDDCANVDTSFPGFVDLAGASGLHIRSGQDQ